jgi:queuosine precursor transporter
MQSSTDELAMPAREPQYLWFLLVSYTMVIAISNWYDARLVEVLGIAFSPGALIFPLSFLLSDAITEVYGYKNARRAIWVAFLFNLLFIVFGQIVIHLPTPSFAVENNAAFDKLLSVNGWIVCASFVSYIISEPLNSYMIAKLKIILKGNYIGIRFIASTIFSALIDSILFINIAFHSSVDSHNLVLMVFNIWIIKSFVEIIGLPFSIRITKWLKNKEHLDVYDFKTNFNPFSLDIRYENTNNQYKQRKFT